LLAQTVPIFEHLARGEGPAAYPRYAEVAPLPGGALEGDAAPLLTGHVNTHLLASLVLTVLSVLGAAQWPACTSILIALYNQRPTACLAVLVPQLTAAAIARRPVLQAGGSSAGASTDSLAASPSPTTATTAPPTPTSVEKVPVYVCTHARMPLLTVHLQAAPAVAEPVGDARAKGSGPDRDVVNADVTMDLYTAVHGAEPKGGVLRAPAAAARAAEYTNLCYVVMSVLGELAALSFEPFVPVLPVLSAFALVHLPNPLQTSTPGRLEDDRPVVVWRLTCVGVSSHAGAGLFQHHHAQLPQVAPSPARTQPITNGAPGGRGPPAHAHVPAAAGHPSLVPPCPVPQQHFPVCKGRALTHAGGWDRRSMTEGQGADVVLHWPFKGVWCGDGRRSAPTGTATHLSVRPPVGRLADVLEHMYTMMAEAAPALPATLADALLTWAIDRHQVCPFPHTHVHTYTRHTHTEQLDTEDAHACVCRGLRSRWSRQAGPCSCTRWR
jgi:hypothetical protein